VPTPGTFAPLNDLWRYDPATGLWTWMAGSNTAAATGAYGTRGTASAGNVPGARYQAVAWTDPYGDLWLHGGQGIDGSGTSGQLNDLWRYRPSAGTWAWMSGSSSVGAAGIYGTKGLASGGNVPGSRAAATGWTDGGGNLWLFGGTSDVSGGKLNDLWKFTNPTQAPDN
jgi:N-acetylneuraminic acid mutarotase